MKVPFENQLIGALMLCPLSLSFPPGSPWLKPLLTCGKAPAPPVVSMLLLGKRFPASGQNDRSPASSEPANANHFKHLSG